MNIFYVNSGSGGCEQYLKKLRKLSACKEMIVLLKESLFLPPLALKLRSGDLLLLFVTNREEFDELLVLKNNLSDFRIILIVDDADSETFHKAHLLYPSFIAFQQEKTVTIEAVINKMTESSVLLQNKWSGSHG